RSTSTTEDRSPGIGGLKTPANLIKNSEQKNITIIT
ncbi:MAG: hypothetical protein H6Q23_1773, partial [Bacteroidetes bacterium]|nr:hypothetical protein [Bacteroidota bacterium]